MTSSWIKSRLTCSGMKELPLWLWEVERHSLANPNCWFLIFHLAFSSLTCRKKAMGQCKALIVRAAVYEKTGGWGGGACSLYSSKSSFSLQAAQPHCWSISIQPFPRVWHWQRQTAKVYMCRKTRPFYLRGVFEDLQMEIRVEIWCCWCGWQHLDGWVDGYNAV